LIFDTLFRTDGALQASPQIAGFPHVREHSI
jgi:hypothetical protein